MQQQCRYGIAVMWVRSPGWDGFWILSGVPLGLVFAMYTRWGGVQPRLIVLLMILLTQTGHLISPMALAWSHDGFRQIMWRQRAKYVMAPLAIMTGATIIAYVSSSFLTNVRFDPISFSMSTRQSLISELKNPFIAMAAFYALWNLYHFSMQAFGVMSIYRHKVGAYGLGQRAIDKFYCCFVTWATMLIPTIPFLARWLHYFSGWPRAPHPFFGRVLYVYASAAFAAIVFMLWREWRTGGPSLPRILFILTDGLGMILSFWFGLWGFAIVTMNHWLVAIGLASHVHANHVRTSSLPFAFGLTIAGAAVFCLLFVSLSALPTYGFSVEVLHFTVTVVGLRLGLGFVHFLYDRWIYKLSDPRVRATIGADLLG